MSWRRRLILWAVASFTPIPVGVYIAYHNILDAQEVQVIKDKYSLFEHALERNRPDDEVLRRATIALSRREGIFLHGKFRETLEAIGEAWAMVESRPWDADARFFWSWQIELSARLSSTGDGGPQGARLRRVVVLDGEADHTFHLRILGRGGRAVLDQVQLDPGSAGGEGVPIPTLPDLREGSYTIEVEVRGAAGVAGVLRGRFHVADRLEERLHALQEVGEEARAAGGEGLDSALASFDYALGILRGEARGERSDFSGDLLGQLRTLELAAIVLRRGKDPYPRAHGDVLRTFVLADGERVPCRVYVPQAVARGEPAPLLLALHGWKDDEHKFFEFYGAGVTKRLAKERGYLVVCPRRTGMEAGGETVVRLVEHLQETYGSIRPEATMVLAHSWGVRQATDAILRSPELFEAVAFFAGAPDPEILARMRLPIYMTCGTRDDRARKECGKFAEQAKASGREAFRYEEVEGVGHVEIIWRQAAAAMDWMASKLTDR